MRPAPRGGIRSERGQCASPLNQESNDSRPARALGAAEAIARGQQGLFWRKRMSVAKTNRPPALLAATAALLAGGVLAASPAQAVTPCTAAAIGTLGVPDVTVTSVNATNPAACVVLGTVHTRGFRAPDGSAQFHLTLPSPPVRTPNLFSSAPAAS